MRGYGKCPRCGCHSLEHLKTHSYCWECNYSPDTSPSKHLNIIDDADDESNLRLKNKSYDDDDESENEDSEIEDSL